MTEAQGEAVIALLETMPTAADLAHVLVWVAGAVVVLGFLVFLGGVNLLRRSRDG